MARVISEKVGRGLCPSRDCNDLVMYRRSSGGMLTHKCDGCDSSGYAAPGSTAHTARMASIEAHNPKPPATPEPSPAPVPASTGKTKPAFSLQNL
jgi:hypothetical protein